MQAERPEQGRQVFRRRVFYIPGYDPFHPRRYRELYRKESAAQGAVSGYEIALKPGKGQDRNGWQVGAQIEGARVESQFEVLVWSDIVQGSMSQTIPATYWQLLRTAWAYIGSGALFRLMRLRKGPMIAALYPIFFLSLQLALALGLGWFAGQCLAGVTHWSFGLLLGAAISWQILRWFRAKDNRIFAWYLMHDYAYSAQNGGANPAALEERIAVFTAKIAAALADDYDEVLVIGHSSGAHLGVSVLADLLRARQEAGQEQPHNLAFLTLGHVVPMVSFLPRAQRLRGDLQLMSAQDQIFWLDVTAPGDGCSFALCDPVCVTGVAPQDKRGPLVISAAFSQTLSPARWKALRRRWFRLHFQYLCAFDQPGDYDYFRITSGPLPLGERFRNRAPSKSRIERPVNRYRDIL